jgi:hypothetical protein
MISILTTFSSTNETRCGRPAKKRTLLSCEQGIAMTEAVVVLPFFLVVWMSMITVHRMYEKRLESQVTSESRALQHSYSGCTGYTDASGSADKLGVGSEAESAMRDTAGWISAISQNTPFGWSHTKGKTTLIATGIPELFGGPERGLTSDQYLLCNMKSQNGLIDMIVNLARDLLRTDE